MGIIFNTHCKSQFCNVSGLCTLWSLFSSIGLGSTLLKVYFKIKTAVLFLKLYRNITTATLAQSVGSKLNFQRLN